MTSNIWPAIQAAAALLLEKHPEGIIIDASSLNSCNEEGAETFVDAAAYISDHDARIVVAALSNDVLEAIRDVPGVRSQLPVADTLEEARASLALDEAELKRGTATFTALVPLVGNWEESIEHTMKLSDDSCEIHVLDLINVPRTLPLGSPMPEREQDGLKKLQLAKDIIEKRNMKCFTHVERVRSQVSGLIEFIKNLEPDFVVMSINRDGDVEIPYIDEKEAEAVLESVECEVSIIKSVSCGNRKRQNVLIPAVGAWKHAIEHACKLADENAHIEPLYIVEVPRSQELNETIPEEEENIIIFEKEISKISDKIGIKLEPKTERFRDKILGLEKYVEEGSYDLVVIAVQSHIRADYGTTKACALALLSEPSCEIVFMKVGG
ncbi:MAG: hypothetical protein SNJ70_09985 [Armatimonadota bacterium]